MKHSRNFVVPQQVVKVVKTDQSDNMVAWQQDDNNFCHTLFHFTLQNGSSKSGRIYCRVFNWLQKQHALRAQIHVCSIFHSTSVVIPDFIYSMPCIWDASTSQSISFFMKSSMSCRCLQEQPHKGVTLPINCSIFVLQHNCNIIIALHCFL